MVFNGIFLGTSVPGFFWVPPVTGWAFLIKSALQLEGPDGPNSPYLPAVYFCGDSIEVLPPIFDFYALGPRAPVVLNLGGGSLPSACCLELLKRVAGRLPSWGVEEERD